MRTTFNNVKGNAAFYTDKNFAGIFTFNDLWGKPHKIIICEKYIHEIINNTEKSLDKCSISNFFNAYDYYSICWDKANKKEMIKTLFKELYLQL